MPSPTASPATARDIIKEIVRNMREGLEPLAYSALPPAVYRVYLHPDDLARLRPIASRIVDEARRALDHELAAMNRKSLGRKLGLTREPEMTVEAPAGGWIIELLEESEESTQPGDIVIYSELALPPKADYGTGSMTKRIATSRLGGESKTQKKYEEAPAADSDVFATIEYEDETGRHTYRVTKNQIVIGRGGRDYWTDLRLETLPDVSREHLRLRRDPASGEFFLKDLSRLGTTVDGKKVPSSIEYDGAERRDKNLEIKLPPRARIVLADVITLEFLTAGTK